MKTVYIDEFSTVWGRHTLVVPDNFTKEDAVQLIESNCDSPEDSEYHKNFEILADTFDQQEDPGHYFEYSEDLEDFDVI